MSKRKNQREALSKFFVDLAKISFGIVVLTAGLVEDRGWKFVALGFFLTLITLAGGLLLADDDENQS
ncbi:hypothetical protein [Geoalkalibacter halelectricus]|uniref:hypothetical protein n=1 Tax=Geoalkalibacter halelectricus TaxID=2847045 RepID=UPI003D1F001F